MAVSTTTALIASAVVAAGSAYTQHKQGQKAADAQKEASRISGNQAQIEQQAQRRQAVREERIRRAQILQASETSGVAGGSGEIGSTGALGSITAGNLASSHSADRTTQRLGQLNNRVASAQQRQQTAGAIGSLSGTVFSSLGGAPALVSGFGNSGPNVDDQITRLVGTSGLY